MAERAGHAKVPLGEPTGGFDDLDKSELTEVAHLLRQPLETGEAIVSYPVEAARPEPADHRDQLGVGQIPPRAGGLLQFERAIHFLDDTSDLIRVDQVGDTIRPYQS